MMKILPERFLVFSVLGLEAAGLILILLSVFADRKTLNAGLLCVVAGNVVYLIRMLWKKRRESLGGDSMDDPRAPGSR